MEISSNEKKARKRLEYLRYKSKYPERVKESHKKWVHTHKDSVLEYSRGYRKSVKYRFNKYRYNAKKRGYEFGITLDRFRTLVESACFYCGQKESIGIDRNKNEEDYSTTNCVPCCKDCNLLKGKFDGHTFVELCQKVSLFQETSCQR